MASSAFLRILVILLGLSQLLICLHAVPVSRIERLERSSQAQAVPFSDNIHPTSTESFREAQLHINGSMDVEVNDYPGSGANNRHTPKPPT